MRDLVDVAVKMHREKETERVRHLAEEVAEERILDTLLRPARGGVESENESAGDSDTRQKFRKMLRERKAG